MENSLVSIHVQYCGNTNVGSQGTCFYSVQFIHVHVYSILHNAEAGILKKEHEVIPLYNPLSETHMFSPDHKYHCSPRSAEWCHCSDSTMPTQQCINNIVFIPVTMCTLYHEIIGVVLDFADRTHCLTGTWTTLGVIRHPLATNSWCTCCTIKTAYTPDRQDNTVDKITDFHLQCTFRPAIS